jgi:hypothetical protein
MKWNCELIQDLLPLYEEELCSPTSRQAVQEHLEECECCRRLTAPLPIEMPHEIPEADHAVKKSIKKVKRRWLASLLAAVLAVPLLLLSFNQYKGSGLCFTNLYDVYTAWQFVHALESGDWEKAAKMHDFSADYESIIEALSQDVAFWGSSFTSCNVAGYDYAARTRHSIPTTLDDLYGYLYNRQGTAMIPAALWERLMDMDPTAFQQNGWEYWLNGERYGKISTSWGEFVVTDGWGYDTAYEYATHFDLIPAAIYEEAKPALDAEAQQLYAATHDHLDWVAGLSEAEFTEEMIRRYTADLGALEGKVTFDCTGYRSAYRMDDSWYVILAVTVTQGSKTLDTEIDLRVSGGKIELAGISHKAGVQWLDIIDRALYPSAHPGY